MSRFHDILVYNNIKCNNYPEKCIIERLTEQDEKKVPARLILSILDDFRMNDIIEILTYSLEQRYKSNELKKVILAYYQYKMMTTGSPPENFDSIEKMKDLDVLLSQFKKKKKKKSKKRIRSLKI